jgi:predicted negative regulator of RcsB-dependent stress response
MVDAFRAGNLQKAEEAFARLQEQTGDATQRMRNQAFYLRMKYEHGADAAALEKLRELADRPEVSGFANRMIGEALTLVGQHKEAADAFDKGAAAYSKDEKRRLGLSYRAEC